VTGANAIQILLIAGIFGQFFLGALYLQKVRHFTAMVRLAFADRDRDRAVVGVRRAADRARRHER
jgi:hypothetical protein